jgi:hypothetical protein
VDRELPEATPRANASRVLQSCTRAILCARALDPLPKPGDLVRLFREDRRDGIPWNGVLAWRADQKDDLRTIPPRSQKLRQGTVGTVVKPLRVYHDLHGCINLTFGEVGEPRAMVPLLLLLEDGARWVVAPGACEVVACGSDGG